MRRPIVYLIGTGPGDPGLITVRGLRCLMAADVVLHDRKVDPRLLRYARPEAERIPLQAVAPHTTEHDAICLLMVEKVREGKVVARLTVDDFFLFGSSGPEVLFLNSEKVPFEVIPGIPSALAAPAYAGVPVTYPGAGETIVIAGERDPAAHADTDWARVARLGGTFVCHAGARRIADVARSLILHGRDGSEPAALIFSGTLPYQDTIEGTLEEIGLRASETVHSDPGTLVVGKVVRFREHLQWFDARPLFGKRIVVTRPKEQAGEIIELLEDLGAETIEAPTIRIVPPEDLRPLDEACEHAGSYDWIVFTSVNGVDSFMRRLLSGPRDVRDLKGVRLCAIGPATAERLERHGIKVDLVPTEYRTEGVLAALRESGDLTGRRILLARADIAREVLADELRRSGAQVTEVVAYRNVPAENQDGEPDIYRMLLDRKIDVVTFTSASTVRNFARILGAEQAADLLKSTAVACIGPVTAEAAELFNIRTTILPDQYTVPGLVSAIVRHFAAAPAGPG